MKRLLLLFLIIGGLGAFVLLRQSGISANKPTHVLVAAPPAASSPQPSPVGKPVELTIHSIGVQTLIEEVGLDSKNNMDVPKVADQAGWYKLGYRPGEAGSSVVDGHFDKQDGSPAVFYKLNLLKEGQDIVVKDELGTQRIFRVYQNVNYDYDRLPLQELFASQGEAILHLITCDGDFDATAKNYSKRRVVSARLVETRGS